LVLTHYHHINPLDRDLLKKEGRKAGLVWECDFLHEVQRIDDIDYQFFFNNSMKKNFTLHRVSKTSTSSWKGGNGGLLVLSRYPIEADQYRRFRLCGKPQRIQHGKFVFSAALEQCVTTTLFL
jgi:hypothetical protein